MTPHPVFAIVSAGLDLDPRSAIFQDAPERPIVLTTELSRPECARGARRGGRRGRVRAGAGGGRPGLAVLHERGLARIHCEGGPHLFADLIAARAVDELCLTVSPRLEGGTASRIATGAAPIVPLGPAPGAHTGGSDTLLLRYVRR